ncbi:MAG: hypothetical protein JW922_09565 [Paludibacteraceae bacterium]|nr:hypothetical protein [Paludibacteraceae bacterium]
MGLLKKYQKGILTALAFAVFGFLALGSTGGTSSSSNSSSSSSNSGSSNRNSSSNRDCDKPGAAVYVELLVKQRLAAPSTAKFPGYATKRAQFNCLGNNTYEITSWVDAQNTYGAMLRKNYYCKFNYDGSTATIIEFKWLE